MDKLVTLLSTVLQLEPAQITDTTSPATVETWDSFTGLLLVSELEKTFNVKFSMAEVVAVKNVADIKAALTRHGVLL